MRRANNQDSYATVPADTPERFERRGHLFVVADGMGAHAAGELASRIAAEKIPQYFLKQTQLDSTAALRQAVEEANADIHRRGQENPEFFNMGTTASSIAITPAGVVVAHVGDSRVYRVRAGKLEQLTFDHSLVWEMEASGQVHPGSSLRHNIPKNVITRSLGPSEAVAVDIEGPFPIQVGDRFLLCSDGLTGQVEDEEIGPLLESLPTQLAARILVDLANLRGGPDNTTVIIIHVVELPADLPAIRSKPLDSKQLVPIMIIATPIGCFLAALLLGLSGSIGPMVVAFILGLIAAVLAFLHVRRNSTPHESPATARKPSRSAPYRTYSAKPSDVLFKRLDAVMDALRSAAKERRWDVDWTNVDSQLHQAQAARQKGDLKESTCCRAKAIIETMAQLRSQHRRSTGPDKDSESVLD